MSMSRKCRQCGETFTYEQGEEWKRICLECWIQNKNKSDFAKNFEHFWNRKSSREQEQFFQEHFSQFGRTFGGFGQRDRSFDGRHKGRPGGDSGLEAEFQENLRALLMLCHPDKHGGSALATRITQWLLKWKR